MKMMSKNMEQKPSPNLTGSPARAARAAQRRALRLAARGRGRTGDLGPVVGGEGVEEELDDGEEAAGEVEEDVPNVPAHGGLARVVEVGLGHVLDERNGELGVGEEVEKAEPRPEPLPAVGDGARDAVGDREDHKDGHEHLAEQGHLGRARGASRASPTPQAQYRPASGGGPPSGCRGRRS